MLRNYLVVAYRHLWRHKGYSLVNLLGLAAALAATLLMAMYVIYETGFDRCFPDYKWIHRLEVIWGGGNARMKFAGAMPALGPAVAREIPGIELAGRIVGSDSLTLEYRGRKFAEERISYADDTIPELLGLDFSAGNRRTALREPNTIILSGDMAAKYFGRDSAIGQSLQCENRLLKVTGVFQPLPEQTHLANDFFISYLTQENAARESAESWSSWGGDKTYVKLARGVIPTALKPQLQALFRRHIGQSAAGLATKMEFVIQPLSEIHWDREVRGYDGPKGNRLYIYVFLSAAVLVLAIGCFNFINFSTSCYLERMKEVGVRKAIGATHNHLLRQFLLESLLMAVMAVGLGGLGFYFAHSRLYEFLHSDMVLAAPHFRQLAGVSVLLVLAVGLVAGAYPAWFLSRFRPAQVLRRLDPADGRHFSPRQLFLVVQFTITIVLFCGTLVVFAQLRYMKNADLGMIKDHVTMVRLPFNQEEMSRKYILFRDELLRSPAILGVSSAFTMPGVNSRRQMQIFRPDDPPEQGFSIQSLPVDFGFISTMGIKLVQGRDFSAQRTADAQDSVILNQSAVNALGLAQPVGARLKIGRNDKLIDVNVIGVVRDFHITSLREKIGPCMLTVEPGVSILALVRFKQDQTTQAMAFIRQTWRRLFPGAEFGSRMLADAYQTSYWMEDRSVALLSGFVLLALMLAGIGLAGYTSFIISRRTREMGIRKVFGASSIQVAALLAGPLMKWLAAACLLGWPLAFIFARRWLAEFSYRVELGPRYFILSGVLTLLTALVVAGSLAWRASRANPVESLRYE